MKKFAFVFLFMFLVGGTMNSQPQPLYKDPSAPIYKRVDDLLKRMTLDEKVAQLLCLPLEYPMEDLMEGKGTALFGPENLKNGLGEYSSPSFSNRINRKPREQAELTNKIQKMIIEKSRLGIPVIFHEEALHGLNAIDATNYPTPLAMSCSFDPDLVHKVFAEVALEASTRGANEVLAPVLDLGREPRWGRTEETYGEDPYLVSRMGVAVVTGFQGNTLPLINRHHVASTLKHFAGHGSPEGGRNTAPSVVDDRTLRDIILKPFKTAVQEAGVKCVMASYNETNGIPSHANKILLTEILRNEWGFGGIVVSDYYGIPGMATEHEVAKDDQECAVKAIQAGIDIDLPTIRSYGHLAKLVQDKKVDMKLIDHSVRRILKLKFELGLFDHPCVNPDEAEGYAGCTAHRNTALAIANESIVLLKNEGNLLPLDVSKYKKIAVIGPNADRCIEGNYANEPKERISPLRGIKEKVGKNAEVLFSQGVRIIKESPGQDTVHLEDPKINQVLIDEAVRVAQQSDIVILCLGAERDIQREAWADNHCGDNASLELRSMQNELVQAIQKTGKPIVVLLFSGCPLSFDYIAKTVPSILECWYLGQETGYAVANVLFGDVNPGGKLSITIPANSNQLPVFYNHKPSRFRKYIFDESEPLYNFGYGLSYTSFKIENIRLAKDTIHPRESVKVFADVTNTGSRSGDEVVQLYIHQCVSSVTRPVKELKDFKRVTLKPAEKKTVELEITPDKLAFTNIDMRYVVEPGDFEIMVGNSSRDQDLQKVKLAVMER